MKRYAELEHFETDPGRGDTPNEGCEVVVNRPTILMKLDASECPSCFHGCCVYAKSFGRSRYSVVFFVEPEKKLQNIEHKAPSSQKLAYINLVIQLR